MQDCFVKPVGIGFGSFSLPYGVNTLPYRTLLRSNATGRINTYNSNVLNYAPAFGLFFFQSHSISYACSLCNDNVFCHDVPP